MILVLSSYSSFYQQVRRRKESRLLPWRRRLKNVWCCLLSSPGRFVLRCWPAIGPLRISVTLAWEYSTAWYVERAKLEQEVLKKSFPQDVQIESAHSPLGINARDVDRATFNGHVLWGPCHSFLHTGCLFWWDWGGWNACCPTTKSEDVWVHWRMKCRGLWCWFGRLNHSFSQCSGSAQVWVY